MGTEWEMDSYDGRVYAAPYGQQSGFVINSTITFDGRLKRDFAETNLTNFFEMIEQLEQRIGKSQYFEWAMTIEKHQPKFWILQIADIDKRLDIFDFGIKGEVFLSGHTVTGSGDKICNKIVTCWNPSDVAALYEFNQHNKDYVLVFSSRLTTCNRGQADKLAYGDFSNASVLLEIQDAAHTGDPIAHLGGQLDMSGKFFAVLDYSDENRPKWEKLKLKTIKEHGLEVYQDKVSVLASESQGKLIVSAIDES